MFRFATLLISLGLVLAAPAASARPASLVGEWRLNLRESEQFPGEPAPAELVMAITKDDAAVFRWTAKIKMPDGAVGVTGFDGAIDGKPYPIQGRPGSTSTFTWMPDGSLKQVSQSAGGIVIEVCSVSTNGRKMMCNARQTDSYGRVATYAEVFDRV